MGESKNIRTGYTKSGSTVKVDKSTGPLGGDTFRTSVDDKQTALTRDAQLAVSEAKKAERN